MVSKHWIYGNKEVKTIEDMPEGTMGIVYIIINVDTKQYYVGKKSLYNTVRLQPLKGEKRKRVVTKESNWKEYRSSNKEVQQWTNTIREILHYCSDKIKLTYYENKALYCLGVLEDEMSMNGNISGKIYKDKILS